MSIIVTFDIGTDTDGDGIVGVCDPEPHNSSPVNSAPEITQGQTLSVEENKPAGTVVGNVAASDPNGGTLTYAITGGNEDGLFFTGTSGQITTNGPLDHESVASDTLAIDASSGDVHDTKGIVPVSGQLTSHCFQGPALGDLGYRGKRLAKAGQALGIPIQAVARGRNGTFIPTGIAWVVERSFAWTARYRRLNTIVERTKEHLVAFVEIAFVSILSRRLKRLAAQEVSA